MNTQGFLVDLRLEDGGTVEQVEDAGLVKKSSEIYNVESVQRNDRSILNNIRRELNEILASASRLCINRTYESLS